VVHGTDVYPSYWIQSSPWGFRLVVTISEEYDLHLPYVLGPGEPVPSAGFLQREFDRYERAQKGSPPESGSDFVNPMPT
jgi:hypothetical protein